MFDILYVICFSLLTFLCLMQPELALQIFYKGVKGKELQNAKKHIRRFGLFTLGITIMLIIKIVG